MRIVDLNRIVRTLEVDKRHLEEHSNELCIKIRDLERHLHETKTGSGKNKASDTAGKKPFITTVRTGEFFPAPVTSTVTSPDDLLRCCRCCKCSSASTTGTNFWKADLQRIQIENRTLTDTMDELKKQVS